MISRPSYSKTLNIRTPSPLSVLMEAGTAFDSANSYSKLRNPAFTVGME